MVKTINNNKNALSHANRLQSSDNQKEPYCTFMHIKNRFLLLSMSTPVLENKTILMNLPSEGRLKKPNDRHFQKHLANGCS